MKKETFIQRFFRRSKEDKFVTAIFVLLFLSQIAGSAIEFYAASNSQYGDFIFDSLGPALLIIGCSFSFVFGIIIAGFSKTRRHVIVWSGIALLVMLVFIQVMASI